ncbi:MAG: hypothetical protein ACKO4U_06820 [Caldilinea sp.]
MRRIAVVGAGFLLLVGLWVVAQSLHPAATEAAPARQRTPLAPTLAITLVVRPLPALPLTATLTTTERAPAVLATQTPRPIATRRATPTPAAALDLLDAFVAVPARRRGQVDLSWLYSGPTQAAFFVVERSADGGIWRPVDSCRTPVTAESSRYRCADTELASGSTYTYQLCIVARQLSCADAPTLAAEPVKAP